MLLAKASAGSSSTILILYVIVFGALYFFYLRPRSKRQKAARQVSRKVEVGDRAQTIGGFVGTVVKDEDGLITLRGASGVELDFIPSAIARKYEPPAPVPTDDDEHSENEEGDKK